MRGSRPSQALRKRCSFPVSRTPPQPHVPPLPSRPRLRLPQPSPLVTDPLDPHPRGTLLLHPDLRDACRAWRRPYSNSPCMRLVSVQGRSLEEHVPARKGRGTQIPACGAGFCCISQLPFCPRSQPFLYPVPSTSSPSLPIERRGRDHFQPHRQRAPSRKSRASPPPQHPRAGPGACWEAWGEQTQGQVPQRSEARAQLQPAAPSHFQDFLNPRH